MAILGVEKTLAQLNEWFYWPGHHQNVQNWCSKCAVCVLRNSPTHSERAPSPIVKSGVPMQLVAVDTLGPFPESEAT